MLPVSSQSRFFLYASPTDMRKSFNGLQGIITNQLNRNALSGEVFIFINKRRDRIKLLVWDEDGFWLFYKRLEKGRFQNIISGDDQGMRIAYETLIMLLEGIDPTNVKRRLRYRKKG